MFDDQGFLNVLRSRAAELAAELARVEALRGEYARIVDLIKLIEARGAVESDDDGAETAVQPGDPGQDSAIMASVRRLLLDKLGGSATVAVLYDSLSSDTKALMPAKNEKVGVESLRYRIKRDAARHGLDYDGGEVTVRAAADRRGSATDVWHQLAAAQVGMPSRSFSKIAEQLAAAQVGMPSGSFSKIAEQLAAAQVGIPPGSLSKIAEQLAAAQVGIPPGSLSKIAEQLAAAQVGVPPGSLSKMAQQLAAAQVGVPSGSVSEAMKQLAAVQIGAWPRKPKE